MSEPVPPPVDSRRESAFMDELLARARAWIPAWGATDSPQDFGRALLRVAARFDAEVAERLDQAGRKMYRGLFDWLAVRGSAARPARMPVVFRMGSQAQDAVLARAPVSMQVDVDSATVNFETTDDVQVLPGSLAAFVGVDAGKDAIYLPPPGLTTLEPLPPLPDRWQLKSFASGGVNVLQLDPEVGLAPDLIVRIAGLLYRLVTVARDVVTIDPGLPDGAGIAAGTPVEKVSAFSPFEPVTCNRQMHVLYLGHQDLLNIESAATIDILGAEQLGTAVDWKYWGKAEKGDEVAWQQLTLAASPSPDAVRLVKGHGAIEPREIGSGRRARWIAAFQSHVNDSAPLLTTDRPLQLAINAANASPPCPPAAAGNGPQIKAEAMANTTPIALGSVFYPLGKLPRQFDAFYLGCPEAFSKANADVQLCFELADPSADAFSVVREGIFGATVLASVGKDRALHLGYFSQSHGSIAPFYGRDPLQPPFPAYGGLPSPLPPEFLDAKPGWRLPVWSAPDAHNQPNDFRVAVTSGSHVWVWGESALNPAMSGWLDFGELPPAASAASKVAALVYLGDPAKPQLAALREGVLALRGTASNSPWVTTPLLEGKTAVHLVNIAPVLSVTGAGQPVTSVSAGMVGISANGDLYLVDIDGTCTRLAAAGLSPAVQPVALVSGTKFTAVGASQALTDLVAVARHSTATPYSILTATLPNGGVVIGGSLEAALDPDDAGTGYELAALASVPQGQGSCLVIWTPQATTTKQGLFTVPVGISSPATVSGAPTVIGRHVLLPGRNADVLKAPFDLAQRIKLQSDVTAGIVVPDTIAPLGNGDFVTIGIDGTVGMQNILGPVADLGKEKFYPIDAAFAGGTITRELLVYRLGTGVNGTVGTTASKLVLAKDDHSVSPGSTLLVTAGSNTDEYVVKSVKTDNINPWVATLDAPMSGAAGSAATYFLPTRTGGRPAPSVAFDAATPLHLCPAALLDAGALVFAGASPERQRAEAAGVAGAYATLVVMEQWWDKNGMPTTKDFLLDASVGDWALLAGDTSSNPELSWEYWNGAWSKLALTQETTRNLKATGVVSFQAPSDIAPTDWAGKTSTWIRARLIGGDYGTEDVTVKTKDLGNGVTEQTIKRTTSGIKPPAVLSLTISYAQTKAVTPTFVLAQDSGTVHDSSDANRTAGATVEAFVPLSLMLGRLGAGDGHQAAGTAGGASVPAVVPWNGRSLFLGFDAPIGGDSANLLFMVASENNYDQFAPLRVEALVGDHFVPVVVKDNTRALGESGIVTLSFGESPTLVELFGQTLNWLRISPTAKDATAGADWQPDLSGIYMNAAWANATETLTRELVGASNGAPKQSYTLQRPPLLADSLELRVREPLGDEERTKLLAANPGSVQTDPNLPGDWVLWRQVVDPGDTGPADRVYRLDEATGTITFGDGKFGAIPPVGTDSIVAFSYQRTEPPVAGAIDVPANLVKARTPINLVTPVAGVEAVFSADHAAGGAPPESDARVLQFGTAKLRNRGRAVTAADLESLALASSAQIAQARAIVSATGTRLIVVMRGPNPAPGKAQQRELTRLLQDLTPVVFSAAARLTIEAPSLRRLRVSLQLSVDTLDHAGAVATDIRSKLLAYLDAANGGNAGAGWPLGVSPTADDIALALLDIAHLRSITDIGLTEALGDGTERAWPATLKASELAQLAADALRLRFDSEEQLS